MAKSKMSLSAAVAHGALMAYLGPKLAHDAKLDLTPILKNVTAKNFDAKIISKRVEKATDGLLALDADITDVVDMLEALKDVPTGEGEPEVAVEVETPITSGTEELAKDTDPYKGKVLEFLQGKLSDEDLAACAALWEGGQEAMDEDKLANEKDNKDKEDMVDKKAMDAAIKTAVKKAQDNARAVRAAEEEVRPYVGKISVAFDSAEEVYRSALESLSVDLTDIHPSAFKTILKMQQAAGVSQPSKVVAMDSASVDNFFTMFPEAKSHTVKHI